MSNHFSTRRFAPAFATTLSSLGRHPKRFFEQMPEPAGYFEGALFIGMIMLFPALEACYFCSVDTMLVLFPSIIIGGLILTWLWTEYMHLALRMFARLEITKPSIFQISAYASAPNILHATVILSPPAFVWQLYLLWRGLVSHAGVESGTATIIIAIPVVMLLCLSLALIMMLALMGMDVVTPLLNL